MKLLTELKRRNVIRVALFIPDIGVFDDWQAHGFPARCRATGGDDFTCD